MEQRTLRLGDIVDDYCPRERRVTNHAIVALVGNSVRQTRCSTCDAEHEYKEARMPKKRVRDAGEGGDLAGGVLVTSKPAPSSATAAGDSETDSQSSPVPVQAAAATKTSKEDPSNEGASEPLAADQNGHSESSDNAPTDAWVSHRPLIRASLPRTDSDPPPVRAIPEFTMHQRQGRGFGGRGGFRHGHHQGNGSNTFRGGGHGHSNSNGNEPDGNRDPQGRPGGGGPGGPAGGGGGRRRRRRRSH